MGTSKISNSTIVTNNTKRIAALKKYVTSSKTEIPIGGAVLKPADVVAVFQDSLGRTEQNLNIKVACHFLEIPFGI